MGVAQPSGGGAMFSPGAVCPAPGKIYLFTCPSNGYIKYIKNIDGNWDTSWTDIPGIRSDVKVDVVSWTCNNNP
jgi:hypothetical protein